jgi:hypothetical protein
MATGKISRHEKVDFRFVCDKDDVIRCGTVIVRDDGMILTVPFASGQGSFEINGEQRGHWFDGADRKNDVTARWADVGGTFVGWWLEGLSEYLFKFRLR